MAFGKHVIFLGAGASKVSGYPLANDLRLLISSRERWHKALLDYERKYYSGESPISSKGMQYWDQHRPALELFRNGGFGTLDEFCKLASGFQFQAEINGLRCLVRAALGIFNPEEHFERSEYYGLVQSLFNDDLRSLREDITILTYNYDPYLDFLLWRALEHRWKVTRRLSSPVMDEAETQKHFQHDRNLNSATSGFYSHQDLNWLVQTKDKASFSLLKLHGSICYYEDDVTGFENLFSKSPKDRAASLFANESDRILPPMVFPWEIMGNGGFAKTSPFPSGLSRSSLPLFQGIWERARRDVLAAEKISFVGLSMHSFLLDGFKYLFEGKQNKVEVVIANPDNTEFVRGRSGTHWNNLPNSPGAILSEFLRNGAPKMSRFGRLADGAEADEDFTLVRDFSSFVRVQMKPLRSRG
jgi:hypothetical protein